MKYKAGDKVIFHKPLMGMVEDGGFILKEIFIDGHVREILEVEDEYYRVGGYGDSVKVKHKDLEDVTYLYGLTEEVELREEIEKLKKVNAYLIHQLNNARAVNYNLKCKLKKIRELLDRD